MKKLLAVLLLVPVFLLVGCAGGFTPGSALSNLSTFTVADLQAALADANAHQDLAAAQCYSTLLTIVQKGLPTLPPKPVGAVSAFQVLRDVTKQGPGQADAIAQQVNLGCAALFVDENASLLRLLTLIK